MSNPNLPPKRGFSRPLASHSRFSILFLFAAVGAFIFGSACGTVASSTITPEYVSPGVILVKKGENLQAALDKAAPGDTIMLEAGASFVGSFLLPGKTGEGFVTIRSSAPEGKLPAAGVRIDPTKYAGQLPKLSSSTTDPVLSTAPGAHHYRFIGVEFGGTKDGVGNIIQIGTGAERAAEEIPSYIEFDRVSIHATSPQGQRRAIAANGRHVRIVNSHISGIVREGDESQAIAAWATDGPIEIINNYLEAAAENILFGGGASTLKLVPADCIVERNHLNKPDEWRGGKWLVKNLFEIKNGRRIKVRNNLMTNNWAGGQDGSGILFTTRADNGPATIIEDIEFTDNIVRNSDHGINVLGDEGSGGHRLTIRNNVFDRIGRFMKSTAWKGLVIENNTIINSGNITSAYGAPVTGFVFRNNIVFENEYGFIGDNTGPGAATIDRYFPSATITSNAIVGGKPERYRLENFYPTSIHELGLASGNLSLRPESPFAKRLSPGRSIGATIPTVN